MRYKAKKIKRSELLLGEQWNKKSKVTWTPTHNVHLIIHITDNAREKSITEAPPKKNPYQTPQKSKETKITTLPNLAQHSPLIHKPAYDALHIFTHVTGTDGV